MKIIKQRLIKKEGKTFWELEHEDGSTSYKPFSEKNPTGRLPQSEKEDSPIGLKENGIPYSPEEIKRAKDFFQISEE